MRNEQQKQQKLHNTQINDNTGCGKKVDA